MKNDMGIERVNTLIDYNRTMLNENLKSLHLVSISPPGSSLGAFLGSPISRVASLQVNLQTNHEWKRLPAGWNSVEMEDEMED